MSSRVICATAMLLVSLIGFVAAQETAPPTDATAAISSVATSTERELAELRERYDKLADDVAELRDDAAAKKAKAAQGFTFKMGGQLAMDMIWFSQSPTARAVVSDAEDVFDFRRARLYANGQFNEVYSYVMGFDFAQGSADNGRPSFLDNYIGVSDLPYVGNFRVGHFFEPFTLERSGSNRNTMFMERSLTDMFAPARNLGLMIYDQNEAQSVWWAVGTFHGTTDNFGDDAGDQPGQTIDVRLVGRPYYDEASGGRYYLHLGAAYSFRDAADGILSYRSRPEIFGNSDEFSRATPFYINTGILATENSQLAGGELLWTQGSLSVESEVVAAPVHLSTGENVMFSAAYVSVAYFLTGEHIPYNRELAITDRVIPFENVFRVRTNDGSIATGRGAWQVAARLSHADLDDGTVHGGKLTDMTLGLNWFLTPWHRIKFNYILADLDRDRTQSYTSIFGLRFDMDF